MTLFLQGTAKTLGEFYVERWKAEAPAFLSIPNVLAADRMQLH